MTEPPDSAIRTGYERWFAMVPTGDFADLRDILTPDWVYTDFEGTVRDRDRYIEYATSVASPGLEFTLQQLEVRDLGSAVLALGRYRVRGEAATGVEFDMNQRFTGLWAPSEAGYVCLAHQATVVLPS